MKRYSRIILPKDFQASGMACGIKKSGKLDLALIYSQRKAKAGALFTTNKIQAAPIKINQRHLRNSKVFQAVMINSGNANSFTAEAGLQDAAGTAGELAKTLQIKKETVLVASTGIIGRRLPLLKIKKAIPKLVSNLSKTGIHQAKKAIMTTDTLSKEITVKFNLGKCTVILSGFAKGAGMIAPHLATMLGFIFTDAAITQGALNQALKIAVNNSFNCITVDGCMSTNDSLIILANGAAKNKLIDHKRYFHSFLKALNIVCQELAWMIVKDAEGATKFMRIEVRRAKNPLEARQVALSVANSNLVKTAMYGENPNFGRIIAAAGASGIDIRESNLKVKISPLTKKEINVIISINRGYSSAVVYTADLTPEYVKINAQYN